MPRTYVDEPSGTTDVMVDDSPLPLHGAASSVARSIVATMRLGWRRAISQPTDHVGATVHFGDGSAAAVYRETVISSAATDEPAVLLVMFRLQWVRGRGHALFHAESLLNTPLFVGFPGFVSKLWLVQDGDGRYRGIYQWNGAGAAAAYARALWWVLALVCPRRSIHYVVLPGLRREDVLADPTLLQNRSPAPCQAWWQLTGVDAPAGRR